MMPGLGVIRKFLGVKSLIINHHPNRFLDCILLDSGKRMHN